MAMRRIGQILVDLGFISEDQLEMLLEEQQQRPGELLGQIAMSMGLITDEQLAQALAEQMGMQVVSLSDVVIPPEVLTTITEPMATALPHHPDQLPRQHADGRHVRSAEALDDRRAAELSWATTSGRWWPPRRRCCKALERYYAAGTESVETLIADMEADVRSGRRRRGDGEDRPLDLTSVEALADSAPVRKLLNMVLLLAIKDHASDLHFEPFESEFKIRIRSRRRALRDGAAAAPPGLRHHHAHQGDGRPGHRRAPPAAGRPHPAERRRPPRRPARQRAADHVRRERGDADPRPLGGHARSGRRGHARRHPPVVPRGDPQAQRHRAGDRADRLAARPPRSTRR